MHLDLEQNFVPRNYPVPCSRVPIEHQAPDEYIVTTLSMNLLSSEP